jgi:hypothetical protein
MLGILKNGTLATQVSIACLKLLANNKPKITLGEVHSNYPN